MSDEQVNDGAQEQDSSGLHITGDVASLPLEIQEELASLRQTMTEIRTLETSIVMDRFGFARQHGMTFNGQRREYDLFGYDATISYAQYRDEYARGGIAGRVVDVMPDACWRGETPFEVIEDEDPDKKTAFEEAWRKLDLEHKITARLQRTDRLSRLSTYSVLLIGASGDISQEIPKRAGQPLLYLKPYSAGGGPGNNTETRRSMDTGAMATIHEYETNSSNPRYGLPKSYRIRGIGIDPGDQLQKTVHWSRIVHVPERALEDDVFGQPVLERVWNLLADLRKITGGGSEAFWLRANQGLHLDVDKDMQLPDVKNTLEALRAQAEAYKHQLDRWIRTKGVKVNTLGSDVANFANPADAVITQIAGATAIPKRILTGSEMGELASSQDRENFRDQVNGRQTMHCGPNIVRQLVDRLIAYGFLPTPQKGPLEYQVKWTAIQVMTEAEKADGAMKWAGTKVGEDPVFTSAEIRDKWYGMPPLTKEQMAEIDKRKEEAVKRQQEAMAANQPPGAPKADDGEEEDDRKPADLRAAEAALRSLWDPHQLRDENGRWTHGGPTQRDTVGTTIGTVKINNKDYDLNRRKDDYVLIGENGRIWARAHVRDDKIVSIGATRESPDDTLQAFTEAVHKRVIVDKEVREETAPGFKLSDKSERAERHWRDVGRRLDVMMKEHGVNWLNELVKQHQAPKHKHAAASDDLIEMISDVVEMRLAEFNPDQARDDRGRWTKGGVGAQKHVATLAGPMTDADKEAEGLKQRALAENQTNPLANAPFIMGGPEAAKPYVAAYGQEFRAAALPDNVRKGPMGECYRNATLLVMQRNDLDYAEGYAQNAKIPGLTYQHAWAVTKDGTVVDPTWSEDSANNKYFGVRYDRASYLAHAVRTKFYGVLGNDMKYVQQAVETGAPRLRRAELRTSAFNPDQARDERGRWTDGDGAPVNKGDPAAGGDGKYSPDEVIQKYGLKRDDVEMAERRILAEAITENERKFSKELAVADVMAREQMKDGDTKSRYTNPDGTYKKERAELHRQIAEKVFAEHLERHGRPVPSGLETPTVTFMAGMPGAGKSTAAKDLDASPNSISIDPDRMKAYLPEYNNGLGSNALARESGDIADKLMEYAASKRMNIVIDGTMKTSGSPSPTLGDGALGKMAAFKDRGYRVETRFVDVSVEESISSTTNRFHEQFQKSGYGRYVPISFSRALRNPQHGTAPRASFEMAKNMEYKGKPLIDAYTHHRGWTGDPKTSNFLMDKRGTVTKGGGNVE